MRCLSLVHSNHVLFSVFRVTVAVKRTWVLSVSAWRLGFHILNSSWVLAVPEMTAGWLAAFWIILSEDRMIIQCMAPVFASVQIYTEPVTKLCHQMSCIYCSVKFTARESYRRTRCVCNSCAPASLSLINQFIHGFIFHKYILLYLIKRIEWICWGENNILCRIQGPF